MDPEVAGVLKGAVEAAMPHLAAGVKELAEDIRMLPYRIAAKRGESDAKAGRGFGMKQRTVIGLGREALSHAAQGAEPEIPESLWAELVGNATRLRGELDEVIETLNRATGHVARQEAFSDMLYSLSDRKVLLDRLIRMSRPQTPKEHASLRDLVSQYENLHDELKGASQRVLDYVSHSLEKE